MCQILYVHGTVELKCLEENQYLLLTCVSGCIPQVQYSFHTFNVVAYGQSLTMKHGTSSKSQDTGCSLLSLKIVIPNVQELRFPAWTVKG